VRLYGAAFVVAGQRSYPRPLCLNMPLFYSLLLTSYFARSAAISCAERRKFVVNRGRGARHEAPLPGQPHPTNACQRYAFVVSAPSSVLSALSKHAIILFFTPYFLLARSANC
jgi:hypothetical protein